MATLLLWLFAAEAHADGKVFPATAYPAQVKIPDQSALLIWSNGIEHLVIETRFVGEGTNFAWVVPLPSVPEIEPATTGLFPTLRYCLQPQVHHAVPKIWAAALFALGLFWLLATVRSDSPASGADLIGCLATSVGAGCALGTGPEALLLGLVAALALLFAVSRVRRGTESWVAILAVLTILFLLFSMLLPALGRAGGTVARAGSRVQILARNRVGVFETTTITARDSRALLEWLRQNGYAAGKLSEPVVAQYVKDGWVFVAVKVRRESPESGAATPHPLAFTFKSAQPVYPMRLTGVGNDDLSLELFVVGPGRAEVKGLKTSECHQLVKTTGANWRRKRAAGAIGHQLFNKWTGSLPFITKLEGLLKSQDMNRDLTISWREFAEVQTRFYSQRGAMVTVANWLVPILGIGVLTLAFLVRRETLLPRAAWKFGSVAGFVCVVASAGLFLALPKVEVRLERHAALRSTMNLKNLYLGICLGLDADQPMNLENVRKAANAIERGPDSRPYENLLQGGQIHEEDSPGNYTLRETPAGIDFVEYTAAGAEGVVLMIEKPSVRGPTSLR